MTTPGADAASTDEREAPTTVLLVEDDAMVRGWLRLSLEGSEFSIVGEAAGAKEAIDLIERQRPALLLIDYRLNDSAGTALIRTLRHEGVSTPAVLMTAYGEAGFNEVARESGAQGSVLKTGSSDELLEVLREVRDGHGSFDPRYPSRDPGRAALSPREREVLRLLAAGNTNRQVADQLEVSAETVKTLVSRTFTKLGVRRRAEAVATAQRMGLL
jgi:DNA-binding NarL/FixJ family response regulator